MTLKERISLGLSLPESLVDRIANKANHTYKTYWIPKRNGGTRLICHPSRELKLLQRWLVRNIICDWLVHGSATAYREGVSIADNARIHAESDFLLRMDFESFFPSFSATNISSFIESNNATRNWESNDINLFIKLVCRQGRLTIGAPSSPGLTNAICHEVDCKLSSLASEYDVCYSRYADDLFFSASSRNILFNFPKLVKKTIAQLPVMDGLRINDAKTRHSSRKGRRHVTGLVLSSDKRVSLGRKRKRIIRSLIFNYPRLDNEQRQKLSGLIAFAKSIEPDFINSLVLKYGPERIEEARSTTDADPAY